VALLVGLPLRRAREAGSVDEVAAMHHQQANPPGGEELQTYSLGKCEPQRAAEIEAFLDGGPDCTAILEAAPDDDLVRHLRGAGPLPGEAAPPPTVPGYEVLAELGRGGMGVVYKARHLELNRLVALKVVLAGGHAGPAGVARFRDEAETVARLQHPNIRRRRHRQALVSPQPLADWLDQLADPDSALTRQWDQEHDRQLARRLLASIQAEFNAKTWQVFRMLVLEEVPAAEVARSLGITANAVYVAKARVLARLRAELHGLMDI
jgi:hypothetical protein